MSRKKRNDAVDLWEDSPAESGLYLVLAGVNKRTDRQLYLSTFEDCDEWSISIVPSEMSYRRAVHMMNKAKEEIANNTKLGTRFGKTEFTLVPADVKNSVK